MSRSEGLQPTDRANIVVVSVRISKTDAALCQEKAGRLGVGISTYIRMLVRRHLEMEGAYRSSSKGEEAVDPFSATVREVAAAAGEASPQARARRPAGPLAKGDRGTPTGSTREKSARPAGGSKKKAATRQSPGPIRRSS